MRIIFGWYSFTIQSYTTEDLNIKNENNENLSFEVRQKCFHLFWIPAFGIGKMYVVRKDGELYNLPPEYIPLIKAKANHKTPWFTFALPILIVLGFLVYKGYEAYQEYQYSQLCKARYEEKVAQMDRELQHITTDHYIKIKNVNGSYRDKALYLKIEDINKENLKAFALQTNLSDYETSPLLITNYYLKDRYLLDTLSLTLDDIRSSICRDYDTFENSKEAGYPLLNDENKYIVEEVKYLKGPILKSGMSIYKEGEMSLEFENIGFPADLVEIRNIGDNIEWSNELPMKIPVNSYGKSYFWLNGSNCNYSSKIDLILVFKDSLDNYYKFNIERDKIERVLD